MAAYNFPASPTNGQTVTVNGVTYTYSTSKTRWQALDNRVHRFSVSETAPSGPSTGDFWFDPNALKTYVYYNDGSSNQWVQANPTGGGGTSSTPWLEKTSAYTATVGDKIIVDTSSAVTITLPASAAIGDEIQIIDGTGNASTNNITIARNGHNIQGDASNLTISTDRAAFGLVYYDTTNGWILMER